MTDCAICCEKFNEKTRKKVSCNYCNLESCRTCVQKYLTEITTDPHCMQCKNIWNREFIDSACTKTFRNHQLKNHRENILFEREKCFLPDAQTILAHRKEVTRLIVENNARIMRLEETIHELRRTNMTLANQPLPTEKRKFVRKCPVSECRGFLSTQWKCEVCDNKICNECNEIKGDEHMCLPENIETMKLLKKDTKPCPNCGTMIFKISGCSQMWCPDCHTAFNWNTLTIEKGVVHNPHFFEFQRLGGNLARNPRDIPCGGIPSVHELYTVCNVNPPHRRWATATVPVEMKIVFDFCQILVHIEQVEMVRMPRVEDNLGLRLRYLENTLSEDGYKSILQKNEKAREKSRDLNNIWTMVVHTGSDLLRQFVNKEITLEQFKEIVPNLISYTNDTLRTICQRYSCVVNQIDPQTFNFKKLQPHGHTGEQNLRNAGPGVQ